MNWLRSCTNRLVTYYRRYQSRRMLLGMDRQALGDIGLTRCDADQEGHKPFWKQ